MRRRTLALVIVGSVVVSSSAGWIAARRITSPADAAARTEPPVASPILVPVESRVLSTDIVTRGTARFGSPQQLHVAPSALKVRAGVVDSVPALGQELVEGDVVLTASGRPVFLLQGDLPVFRDLGPGLEGDDVLQLEEGLDRLGFAPGPIDGTYDRDTEVAVSAWYAAAGWAAMNATPEQLAGIRLAEQLLANARLDVLNAQGTVVTAERDLSMAHATLDAARVAATTGPEMIRAAEAAAVATDQAAAAEVAARQVALDQARGTTPAGAGSPSDIAAALATLEAARASASSVAAAGARNVAEAEAQVANAPAALAAAQAGAAAANAEALRALDNAVATREAVVSDPASTPAQVSAADSAVAAALSTRDSAALSGQQAVVVAQQAAATAGSRLSDARAEAAANDRAAAADVAAKQVALDAARGIAPAQPAPASVIAAAQAEVMLAQANATTVRLAGQRSVADTRAASATAQAGVSSAEAELRAAERTLALARQSVDNRNIPSSLADLELGLDQRRAGVQVPADEIIFVATAPVRVSELLTARSSDAFGAVVAVTDAVVFVDASLALDEARLVAPGTEVLIDESGLGIDTVGVVNRVAEAPGTNGVDGFHVYAEILVAEPPANLVGASVRLTIAAESSGTAVLAVPISAVTLDSTGSSVVEVHRSARPPEIVTVDTGLSAGGYVEVTPLGGDLSPGDLVSIGTGPTTAGPTTADADGTGPGGPEPTTAPDVTTSEAAPGV